MNPEDQKKTPKRLPRDAHRAALRAAKNLVMKNQNSPAYWREKRCQARRVEVIVGHSALGDWCFGLAGTVRSAVEITADGRTFFIDDPGGAGWLFVTIARGAINIPHRLLPVLRIIEKPETVELATRPELPEELDQ